MPSGLMTPGTAELTGKNWGLAQELKNSYRDNVIIPLIKDMPWHSHQLEQYGELDYIPDRYPLYHVKVGDWKGDKPIILITGGVHGYEAGGIEAAKFFLKEVATNYTNNFDFLVYPCVSPSAYEIDSRWNMMKQDTNRGFKPNSDVQEARYFIDSINKINKKFVLSIDLHETPPEDLIILKEQGKSSGLDLDSFPQSFYILEACPNKDLRLGDMINSEVEKLVPICQSDKIFGFDSKKGVINEFPTLSGLCMTYLQSSGWTEQAFTTETYTEGLSMQQRIAIQIKVIDTALTGVMNR